MTFINCSTEDFKINLNFLLTRDAFEIDLFKPGTFIGSSLKCDEEGFDIESQSNNITVANNYANNEHWIYDVTEDEFRSKLINELDSLYPKAESYADLANDFLDIVIKHKTNLHVFFKFNKIEDTCRISYIGIGDTDDLELKFYEGIGYLLKALKLDVWNLNKEEIL